MRYILFFSILLFSFNINAKPSPLVADLMKEPLTLFDYGMIKLRKNVERIPEWRSDNPYNWAESYNDNLFMLRINKLNGEELDYEKIDEKLKLPLNELEILNELKLSQFKNVFYDFETNRINYNLLFEVKNKTKNYNVETNTCLYLRNIMAYVFLNIKGNMIYQEVYEANKIDLIYRFKNYYFAHEGYTLNKFPEKLYEELVDMIYVNVYIDTYDSNTVLSDEERWIYCEGPIFSARPNIGKGGGEVLPEFFP